MNERARQHIRAEDDLTLQYCWKFLLPLAQNIKSYHIYLLLPLPHFPLLSLQNLTSPVWSNLHKVHQLSQYSTKFSNMKALGVLNSNCFPSSLPTSKSSELPEAREAAGSLMPRDLQSVNTKALMLLRTSVHILML